MEKEHMIKSAALSKLNLLNNEQLDNAAKQAIVNAIVAAIAEYDKQNQQQ